jgi:hypothetical protein
MNTLSIAGAVFVTLALVSYSIAILTEQFRKTLLPRVMIFISLGVALDITATLLMILGSRNSPFTVHGFVGYSALFVMLIECFMLWRLKFRLGIRTAVPLPVHRFSLFAYIWWIVAYITGSLIALT